MTTELPQGVSVILYRHGKFAVSQRLGKDKQPHLWQFPGGHVEPGEEPLAAAVRELREETGLSLPESRFKLLGKTPPLVGYKGDLYIGNRYGVMLEFTEEPACTEPHKATPWQWVDPRFLVEASMLQATKEYALMFALELIFNGPPRIR